jgi:hypothetical protein
MQCVDDNLTLSDGVVRCAHCTSVVVEKQAAGGAHLVAEHPIRYEERAVVFRQAFCPGCRTSAQVEVTMRPDERFRTNDIKGA